jgi:NAD(P)-dependent dehydrogenase (short-subunit alcohol dehydrogenase family)
MMMAQTDLTGRVAVVTGAARGLGRAYAQGLAKAGATVIALDLSDCSDTVRDIETNGGRAFSRRCDVGDMTSCRAAVDDILTRLGRVDVLVNNAALFATLKSGRFDTIAEDDWESCMRVNVTGVWNCCRAFVPPMRERGGSVVNISSLAATYGLPNALHYTTSKAAVIGLTRGLARELGRFNIRVNAVAPAVVETDGMSQFFGEKKEDAVKAIFSGQSIRRVLTTDDLVGTILYLASDASSMVTGQTIAVDGGTVSL